MSVARQGAGARRTRVCRRCYLPVLLVLVGLHAGGACAQEASRNTQDPASNTQPTAPQEAQHTATKAMPATVEQPRTFGYVIGDVLTQRVLLEANGRRVRPRELPQTGRVSAWFDRRAVRVVRGADGRRWLAVDYQLINAPGELTALRLPAWYLETETPGLVLHVSEWLIRASPLTVAPAPGADAAAVLLGSSSPGVSSMQPEAAAVSTGLRPDRTPPLVPVSPIVRLIAILSSALVLTIAAWIGWVLVRNRREALSLPFASACREIRHLDEDAPAAWQALHRAFDRTAGRVVQLDSLSELFSRAPHFAAQKTAVEQFFAQSSERFFGSGMQGKPISVHALCEALGRLERKHEP